MRPARHGHEPNIRQLFPDHGADREQADREQADLEQADAECEQEDDEQPPLLMLDEYQRAGLAAAVEAGLRRGGCDNTLRSAERWAEENGIGAARMRKGRDARMRNRRGQERWPRS